MNEVLIRRLLGAAVLLAGAFLLSVVLPEPGLREPPEPDMRRVEVDVDDPRAIEPPADTPPPGGAAGDDVPHGSAGGGPRSAHQAVADDPSWDDRPLPPLPEPAMALELESEVGREAAPDVPRKAQPPAPQQAGAAAKPAAPGSSKPAPGAAPPAGAGERWIVQAGSYADIANARRVQSQLKALGLSALIAPAETSSGTRYRVRTTAFASREQAEAARRKLEQARITASVVHERG